MLNIYFISPSLYYFSCTYILYKRALNCCVNSCHHITYIFMLKFLSFFLPKSKRFYFSFIFWESFKKYECLSFFFSKRKHFTCKYYVGNINIKKEKNYTYSQMYVVQCKSYTCITARILKHIVISSAKGISYFSQ